MKNYKVKEGYVLVLRTNNMNNQSYMVFQYPTKGYVEAPDWEPTGECGNGLHGALRGVGNGSLFNWSKDAIWMVLEVKENEIIDLDGKVKFKGGNIVYCGNRQEATQLLYNVYGNVGIIGLDYSSDNDNIIVVGGNGSTLTGGDMSTLTGGDGSTLRGGYESTLTGGDRSILTGGNRSTLTGGDGSTLNGGYGSTLTGGFRSTLTGGKWSTLCAGENSTLNFTYLEGNKTRFKTYYVGEDGIKPNTKYRLNDRFEIEEVK